MHSLEDCHGMRVEVHRDTVGGAVVVLSGDLDTHSASDLNPVLGNLIGCAPASIALDLEAVTFFSCAAVTELQKAGDRYPGQLHVAGASRVVARILAILELDDHLRPVDRA